MENKSTLLKASEINNIYAHMGDELSKYIYSNRLMFSLTGDCRYIRNIICTNRIGKEIYEKMKEQTVRGGGITIFGCGIIGKTLVDVYDDISFEGFVDNNCYGKSYKGLEVISWEKYLEKKENGMILISAKYHYAEIMNQILNSGIHENQIINLGKEYAKLSHMQYFDLPELDENKQQLEVFVDGGCYDADTAIDFIQWCRKVKVQGYVYAYELEATNQKLCANKLEKQGIDHKMIPYGLWSERTRLHYVADGKDSNICEDGTEVVEVDCIDSLSGKLPIFIKMDIEGAEYQALWGAKETIKKYKPKLAICIYHKNEDIWELPELILQLNPAYKLYLRHYSFANGETVLYAI